MIEKPSQYMLISERDAILSMLAEKHNKLRSFEVSDRLFRRQELKGLNQNDKVMMGKIQAEMKQLKEVIADLLDFLKDAKSEPELAKTVENIIGSK